MKLDKKVTNTKDSSATSKSKAKAGHSNLKIVEPKRDVDPGKHTARNKELLLVDQPPTYVLSDNPIIVKRRPGVGKKVEQNL